MGYDWIFPSAEGNDRGSKTNMIQGEIAENQELEILSGPPKKYDGMVRVPICSLWVNR